MTKIPFNPMQQIILVIIALSTLFAGCKSNTENSEQNSCESLPEEKNIVETVILENAGFHTRNHQQRQIVAIYIFCTTERWNRSPVSSAC